MLENFTYPVFLILVAFLFMISWQGIPEIVVHQGTARSLRLLLLIWLCIHAGLAVSGFFLDFNAMPPRIALILLPGLAVVIMTALLPASRINISLTTAKTIVFIQSFRILMEGILWELIEEGKFPHNMTFTGRNFDILIGATAPFVGFLFFSSDRITYPRLLALWNILGLGILGNTVITGILTAPTPFQVYFETPANTLIAEFPWVWLPAFVVPFALTLHVISLRQALVAHRMQRMRVA